MATAGHSVAVKLAGTAVATTGEATTDLGGDVYQVTTASKRIIDPNAAVTVYDGATPIAAANVTVDYLFGKFTLSSTPVGAVTADFSYLPVWSVAEARAVSINQSRTELEDTVFGDTAKSFMLGLKSADGTIESLDMLDTDLDTGGTTLVVSTLHDNGTAKLLEVDLGDNYWRGWVLFPNLSNEAAVDELAKATITWKATALTGNGQTEGASFGLGT